MCMKEPAPRVFKKHAQFLDTIISIPRRFDSYEEDIRFLHADLVCLSRIELWRERDKLKLRLLLDNKPHA